MKSPNEYLRICHTYCNSLGGFRWSQGDDAVEFAAGSTFVFAEEVAQFLEGFAARQLLHFAHVLHLLTFLRGTVWPHGNPQVARLRRVFGGRGTTLRNAGAFFATLCGHVPALPGALTGQDVINRLRNTQVAVRWFVFTASDAFGEVPYPALEPGEFEEMVLRQVEDLTDPELKHWFRHGTGPVKGAGTVLTQPLPQTLDGTLAAALERPRLAGARALVPQLLGALTLPRPHRLPQELPTGGYADVVTRGNVDQILPAQFALDDLEFLRRYAGRELLYYRREEPHARLRRELVLVVDQGVRTWGTIRLVLAAAVVAFGRQAARGKTPFLLATTGAGQVVDAVELGVELGEMLEASDLSAQPGPVLADVLEQSAGLDRDIVLLTHRRSLREVSVKSAAARVAAPLRLFALTLDESERAELAEMRQGYSIPVRQFRVDFGAVNDQAAVVATDDPLEGLPPWSGDIEPIGYPFRFGLTGPILGNLFTFDHDGQWFLTVCQGGMLHLRRMDGSVREILPRGMVGGQVLTEPKAVVGVAGGFALVDYRDTSIVAVQYDIKRRTSIAHVSSGRSTQDFLSARWTYSPEFHALIIDRCRGEAPHYALDLTTGEWYFAFMAGMNRARQAWEAYHAQGETHRSWPVITDGNPPPSSLNPPYIWLDSSRGQLHVQLPDQPHWPTFIPRTDGRPTLQGSRIIDSQCRGNTLVLKVNHTSNDPAPALLVFRGPSGETRAIHPLRTPRYGHTLSANGEFLAMQTGAGLVRVHHVEEGTKPRFTIFQGGYPMRTDIFPSLDALVLNPDGRHFHALSWKSGKLELTYTPKEPNVTLVARAGSQVLLDGKHRFVSSFAATGLLPYIIGGFPERFAKVIQMGKLIVALDRFGQVSILDASHNLVCMMFARRREIGLWLPDGTRAGSANLTGGPPTPGALEKIGTALLRASGGGTGT